MVDETKFIVTSDLESYFVNKITGAPLAAGVVTFYEDNNRTQKKAVYQLTGSPGAYNWAPLPNPCTLSAVGTFQDALGNNIVPYYYPYEGLPEENSSVVEKYYIDVKSSGAVSQFTRENWPPMGDGGGDATGLDNRNFIANGQFVVHNDIISTLQPPPLNDGTSLLQPIAQGGWFFIRSVGGTSTFDNSFERITTGIGSLNDYPRYGFNFKCTNFVSDDQVHDIAIQFEGVNTFSGGDPVGSQPYTFVFAAESNNATTYTFEVFITYNFGTGGSPSISNPVSLGTISITPTYAYKTIQIPGFDGNTGTLGTNNDDYVQISLRSPESSFDVQLTDFMLFQGTETVTFYPPQPQTIVKAQGILGSMPIPNPNGSDLYLPVVYTLEGAIFDSSVIGKIYGQAYSGGFVNSLSVVSNEILCDGTELKTTDYSPLGIPYARLWTKIFDLADYLPLYGTGNSFGTVYTYANPTNQFRLTTNKAGLQTATANGATSPTFTIATSKAGTTAYDYFAYPNAMNTVLICYCKTAGVITGLSAGTSGLSLAEEVNAPGASYEFTVEISSLPAAGTYFTFRNTATNYYMWFTINGAGADPAPGGTGILCPLLSTYTIQEAIGVMRDVIAGCNVTQITTVAGSAIPAGAWFTFYTNGVQNAVWYKKAGAGTAPAGAFTRVIQVDIDGTETAAQIVTKTKIAINGYQYAVPNLNGAFLRGVDLGSLDTLGDQSSLAKYSLLSQYIEDIGSYQTYANLQHAHGSNEGFETVGTSGTTVNVGADAAGITGYSGQSEPRPFNFSVQWVIKY